MKERIKAVAANTLLIGGIAMGVEGLVTNDYIARYAGCLVAMSSFPLIESREPVKGEREYKPEDDNA